MLYHTVLFQFSPETTDEEIDDVLGHLREIKDIPAVQAIEVGTNQMPVTDGWTHGMTITFPSFEAMMAEFADHPLHRQVMRDQLPRFSRYMAMDVGSPLG